MLFDPRPKMNREELFDREEEIDLLKKLADKPLVLLLGIRRNRQKFNFKGRS